MLLGRRKLESVPKQFGVDVEAEEGEGRLVQHVEGESILTGIYSGELDTLPSCSMG